MTKVDTNEILTMRDNIDKMNNDILSINRLISRERTKKVLCKLKKFLDENENILEAIEPIHSDREPYFIYRSDKYDVFIGKRYFKVICSSHYQCPEQYSEHDNKDEIVCCDNTDFCGRLLRYSGNSFYVSIHDITSTSDDKSYYNYNIDYVEENDISIKIINDLLSNTEGIKELCNDIDKIIDRFKNDIEDMNDTLASEYEHLIKESRDRTEDYKKKVAELKELGIDWESRRK